MKEGYRFFVAFFLMMSFLLALSACRKSPSISITEDALLSIMDEVENATVSKDIDGVMKYLAPSVVIHVTLSSPYGPQKVPMSREKYREETLKGWSMTSDYEYSLENEEMKISDDGKVAVVETDVIESYVMGGNPVKTTTHERITLQVMDGEILVTRIDALLTIHSDTMSPLI